MFELKFDGWNTSITKPGNNVIISIVPFLKHCDILRCIDVMTFDWLGKITNNITP